MPIEARMAGTKHGHDEEREVLCPRAGAPVARLPLPARARYPPRRGGRRHEQAEHAPMQAKRILIAVVIVLVIVFILAFVRF